LAANPLDNLSFASDPTNLQMDQDVRHQSMSYAMWQKTFTNSKFEAQVIITHNRLPFFEGAGCSSNFRPNSRDGHFGVVG
jgi:hypothetical protein